MTLIKRWAVQDPGGCKLRLYKTELEEEVRDFNYFVVSNVNQNQKEVKDITQTHSFNF